MLHAYDPAPRQPSSAGERGFVWVFGLFVGGLLLAEMLGSEGTARYSLGFILLAWTPMLLVHELGHALSARALGWHVHELVIGYGPELLRFRVGQTRVVFRLVPVEGYVLPTPRTLAGARYKSALVYASGPGAELAVVGLLALLFGPALWTRSAELSIIAAQSVVVTGLLGAAMNLLPHAAGGSASDGLGILLSFGISDTSLQQRLALPFVLRAEGHIEHGNVEAAWREVREGQRLHPGSVPLQIMATRCQAAQGDAEAATHGLEAIRALPDLPAGLEADALHAAARLVLDCGQPDLLPEAEEACQAALVLSPDDVRYLTTLGQLRLERGQRSAALTTLQAAYRLARQPHDEDRCLGLLALTHHALAQPELAARFARVLLARCPTSRLAERVRERVLHARPA